MNPDEKFERIIKEAKEVSLEEEEKADIKRSVISFIEKNRTPYQERESYVLVNPFRFLASPAALAVLIIVALTGGIAFASENALPGDLLYPIKVNVSEKAGGMFVFSDEAKTDFEAERLNRRMEEAEKLAMSGKLNSEARMQIENNFEKSSEKVKVGIRKFESNGDFETSARINSKFEASLKTHGRILKEVIEKIDEIKASEEIKQEIKINLNPLSLKVKKEAKEANDSKERAEEMILEKAKSGEEVKSEIEISVKKALKSAEDKVAESKRFVKRAEKSIGEEALAEVEAKIQDAEKAVSEGKARMDSGDVSEILILFRGASFLAQEAEVLAKAKMDLKIEIRLEEPEEENNDNRGKNRDEDDGGKGGGGEGDERDNSGRNGGGEEEENGNSGEDNN